MMNKTKKTLAVALTAVVLTAASFAATGEAFAKGGGGGHGGHGHGHGFWGRGGIVLIDSGCWTWLPGHGRVNICY
jgi:hypothetical protein